MLTDLEEQLPHPKKTSLGSHDTVQVVHPLTVGKKNNPVLIIQVKECKAGTQTCLFTSGHRTTILSTPKVEPMQVPINR